MLMSWTRLRFTVAALFAFSLIAAAAPPPLPADDQALPPELAGQVDRRLPSKAGDLFVVLKNGLTVLIREDPKAAVASTQVFVRAGSLYEGQRMGAGLSHYLEHVVAGGSTRSFTEDEARARLERLGGASNAYTSYDRTVYYIDSDGDHWREALDLVLAYVTECALAPTEVNREKAVIQQEFKLGENNPRRRLWELFLQTAYRVNPVRHPVIGYESVFVRQDREALLAYYHDRYQPQNMVLAVVGAVRATEVLRHVIEKAAAVERTRMAPVQWPEEPYQINARRAESRLPMARLTQAIVGFPSVQLAHPDLFALDVLAILLGEGRTSRLYQRLKDRDQLVLSVSSYNWTPAFAHGQFIISLDLAPQQWSKVQEALEDELTVFKKTGCSSEELDRAKKKVIAQRIFDQESASDVASSLASSYLDTADPYFEQAYVDGVRAVTVADVLRVAKAYLVPERSTVAAVHPEETKTATAATAIATADDPANSAQAVDEIKLANGLRVLLKEDHRLPITSVQLYGLGGLLLDQEAKPGLTGFTAALLTAGTTTRTKQQIAATIEDVGGSISSGAGNNTYSVSIRVLQDDLPLALELLADVVLHSQFPDEEIDRRRQETLLAIERQDEDWQREVLRLFKANFFKNHPYGSDELGTKDSVTGFSRADVIDCYQRMVRPQQAVLAVYGDFDAAAVKQRIGDLFEAWAADPVELPVWPEETAPLTADQLIEHNNDKTSAALFLGTNGLALDDPLRPALDVLDALLSGINYPGGRLHEALRGGTANLVYVVHAFPFYGLNAGYFGVLTQTTMKNLPKVEKIIKDNLDRLKTEPVSAATLETAKDMVITMHHLGLESLAAQAQRAAVDELMGLGRDYAENYPRLVQTVTAADVQTVAQRLFAHRLLVRTLPEHPVEVLEAPPPRADVR